MVIVQNSSGQLGNKLLISAHVMAYCLNRKEAQINAVLGSDANYFSVRSFARNRIFVVGSKRLLLLFSTTVRWIQQATSLFISRPLFDIYQVGWVHTELNDLKRSRKKGLILEGEGFRSTVDIQQHQATIRKLFTPKLMYTQQVDIIIDKLKIEGSLLIGIHLRRGDYKHWQAGNYYYDDQTYLNYIEQAQRLFNAQSIQFILCSDEPINKEVFHANNIYISTSEVIVDLCVLAKCDYIIGPPSTFSGWASFYGQVPIQIISHKNETLSRDCFIVNQL